MLLPAAARSPCPRFLHSDEVSMARNEPQVFRFAELESTNVKLRSLINSGAPEGTLVVARTQTGGKGRLSRSWHSPVGGLYASLAMKPHPQGLPTDLALLAGVAVQQTITEKLPKQIESSLKWPNDCLVNWCKVAGILCEVVPDQPQGLCIVGIGVNVNIPPAELKAFQDRPFRAASLSDFVLNSQLDTDAFLELLVRKLGLLRAGYAQDGFPWISGLWEANCRMMGKMVEIATGTEPNSPTEKVVFLGLDAQGGMKVRTQEGREKVLYSGEIRCLLQSTSATPTPVLASSKRAP